MKFKDGSGRLEVAIAHDGALFIDDGLHAATFRIKTIMNGSIGTSRLIRVVRSSRPSAPVSVVGSKIVPELMRHHIEIPSEIWGNHRKVGLVVHGAAESA